jgi:hypothetical protein
MPTNANQSIDPPLLRIFRDPAGDLRAEDLSRRTRRGLLISFLESEVQGSVAAGREILEQLAQVVAGERPRATWIGNAHRLTMSKKTARIVDEIDPEAPFLRLPLADLYSALDAWLDVLEGNGPLGD